MAGSFLPILETKFPALRSILEKRLPNSAQIWNVFKLFENNRYSEKVETKFLSFNGDVDDSGLIVAVQHRKILLEDDIAVVLSGPTDPHLLPECLSSEIIAAFEKALDWKMSNVFCATDDELAAHLQLLDMCKRNGELVHSDPNYMYYIPNEDALKLDVAEKGSIQNGIVVSPLSVVDGKTVTDYWKFSGPGTLERMEDAIETIGSAGVYVLNEAAEPGTNQLASWVIFSQFGSMNALFTHPDHRRKGFAKLTMEAVSKWAAQDGLVPTVQVQLENSSSKILMEKLGFLYSHRVSWIIHRPQGHTSL